MFSDRCIIRFLYLIQQFRHWFIASTFGFLSYVHCHIVGNSSLIGVGSRDKRPILIQECLMATKNNRKN